jgi:hypothetical protein
MQQKQKDSQVFDGNGDVKMKILFEKESKENKPKTERGAALD